MIGASGGMVFVLVIAAFPASLLLAQIAPSSGIYRALFAGGFIGFYVVSRLVPGCPVRECDDDSLRLVDLAAFGFLLPGLPAGRSAASPGVCNQRGVITERSG